MKKFNLVVKFLVLAGIFVALNAALVQASQLDLSLPNSDGWINGAWFSRDSESGQGSGNFDPFLRVKGNGSEIGYNTDGVTEFDTMSGGNFTRSIAINDIPLVTVNNVLYREFILDAGENNQSTLQIDVLELYLLGEPDVSGYPTNFPPSALKYELLEGNSILLDNMQGGNGNSDMYAYIPDSYFTGTDPYLYLYTEMSYAGGTFEEWGFDPGAGTNPVPEPTTMMLLGFGLIGTFLRRRKI